MATNIVGKHTIDGTARGHLLRLVWNEWRIGTIIAAGIPAAAGLLVALTMPHGPATAGQALLVMAMGLAIGLTTGLALPSRWTMLLAPAAHILVIEIARLNVAGPTVDAIRLDNLFAILAFVLGRGFHGLVGLLPMILGVRLGMALARLRSGRQTAESHLGGRWRSSARWMPTTLLAIALLVLALLIALPASTPPILGRDGKPLSGSIAELATVPLGGQEQAILIRGHSTENPVLLYLSGGPGQSSLPFPRAILDDLTQAFILVAWDQRGTGKSYAALDPTRSLTVEQAVSDTIELTNYLRDRFDEEKIYLLGESWGTTLGVLAVQQRPDLYYAFIGSGQMVSQRETDRRLFYDLLDFAAQTGDEALAAQMQRYGEPPYQDLYAYSLVMGYYEALYKPYTPPPAYLERGEAAGLGPWGILGSEYNLVEKVNVLRGLIDMFSIMYPQLQEIDFRRDVPRLEVPVYILDGEAELAARRDLTLEWYNSLAAPSKRLYSFPNAAHATAFEQFEAFHQIMVEVVLLETYGK